MSATILAFPTRTAPAPEPVKQPIGLQSQITKSQCDHLDRAIDGAVNVLDVVRSGPERIKQFLAGKNMLATTIKHEGVEYELQISLIEKHTPRFA